MQHNKKNEQSEQLAFIIIQENVIVYASNQFYKIAGIESKGQLRLPILLEDIFSSESLLHFEKKAHKQHEIIQENIHFKNSKSKRGIVIRQVNWNQQHARQVFFTQTCV